MIVALYHFSVKQIRRSAGQSAVASAAYRAGEKLVCNRYGETHDYTRKRGVIHTEIFLPDHAPREYLNRETLWNAVEKAERGCNAQLAYSFDIALQSEFSIEENIALARVFVQEQFIRRGMIADLAVHAPEKDGGVTNPHFHVMTTMRPIEMDGRWGCKQHRVHHLDENGNRMRDASGKLIFDAVPTTDWGRPETLEHWRAEWCRMCNDKFSEKNLPERIDHRSYARQGIEQIPTVHEGPIVRQMEARGITTDKGELNRWIRKTNELLRATRRKIRELTAWIAAVCEELERPEQPMLAQLLADYCVIRNAAANSFSYGKQKAKVGNLKRFAEAITYLNEHELKTVADLDARLDTVSSELYTLTTSMKAGENRTEELKELIRYAEICMQVKPLIEEMNAIHFKGRREKFRSAHEPELKQFYMAMRKLKEHGISDGHIPVREWKSEIASIKKAHEDAYVQYKSQRDELSRLYQVKHAVDTVLKDPAATKQQPAHETEVSL